VKPRDAIARRRARRRRARRGSARRQRRTRRSAALTALTAGALALPGLARTAAAEGALTQYSAEYNYSRYSEDPLPASKVTPGGERGRYDVDIHQIHLAGPLFSRVDLGLDLTHEKMSGASPWYVIPDANGDPVQVMSGATIEDERTDALLEATLHFDSGSTTFGGGISSEKDYLAWNGSVRGERNFNDKRTTLSAGSGFSIDRIDPVDANLYPTRPSHENKWSSSVFVGLAQVLNRESALQSSLTFQRESGYLSDPYKEVLVAGTPIGDSRPDTRNQISWLTRYRHHVEPVSGTLQADYRFYADDWKITSHTLEVAWDQAFWDALHLIPSFRYYSQSQADFYGPYFENAPSDGLASSDYRLSPYGAISWRLKAETRFATGPIDWRAAFSWQRYLSAGDYALGKVSVENPGLVSFNVYSIALTAKF